MLGVHPRLNQLLVTHLKELNAESLIYDSGDVVIEEQQHADDILLLQSGELSVEIGAQRELARIKPGELLGEMGLSGDNRHSATVRVLHGPAEIIRVAIGEVIIIDPEGRIAARQRVPDRLVNRSGHQRPVRHAQRGRA